MKHALPRLLLCCALGAAVPSPLRAGEVSLDELAALPVLDGGRPLPLDTFARHRLLQISGRSRFARQPAIRWLGRVWFDPESTVADPVFLIGHPETVDALQLPPAGHRMRASFGQLDPRRGLLNAAGARGHATPPQNRTPAEQDLLRLDENLHAYDGLLLTSTRIVPVRSDKETRWLSPAEALSFAPGDAEALAALSLLREMKEAYAAGAQSDFDRAVRGFRDYVTARLPDARDAARVRRELLLNRIDPFFKAQIAYGLAFMLALIHAVTRSRAAYRLGVGLVLLGLLPHTAGLALRIAITGRPPVTNLYSTFLFVAWAVALLGLLLEGRQRNGLGLLAAGLGGLGLLLVSSRFGVSGDTMQKVVAILDSNLWLTAHVLTIMVGFAGCLMAGIAGHVYLLQAGRRPARPDELEATYRSMTGFLALGLTFTFLGTMLGGVWADRAWGRFWGWDPKENGALLVILWCAILFHARPAGLVRETGMAAGCALCNVIVALAWLGVNLLGVGLHSYGWMSGAATGLLVFTGAEIAFVGVFAALAGLKARTAASR